VLKGLGIVLVVCALAPATALAGDYYVTQAGTGTACTSSSTPCDLATALGQANVALGPNTVHITGPLSLTGLSPLAVGNPTPGSSVSLVGSGSGAGGTSLSGSVVLGVGPGSSVSHLALQGSSTALVMALGSSVDDVVATTTGTVSPAVVIVGATGPGDATISHSVISSPMTSATPALVTGGDTTHRTIVSDSRITGGGFGVAEVPVISPVAAVKGAHITRTVIDAGLVGFAAAGTDSSISDSVIHVRTPGGAGVSVLPTLSIGEQPHADVLQDTIIGPDDLGSNGVLVQSAGPGFRPGSATVTGSIVRGWDTGVNVQPPAAVGFASGSATATLSDFDDVVSGSANLAVDPRFVDASSEDYRLASGSPMIDAAGTAPANGETDLAGNDRVTDGNGDGTAARDMGAFESPGVAPHAQPQPPAAPAPKKRVAVFTLKLPHGTLTFGNGRIVLFNVGCPKRLSFGCRVTVTLRGVVHSSRSRTIKLGTGRAITFPGAHAKVRIRLTRKAASLITRGKLRKVTAQVVGQDAAGATAKPKRTYRIRYRRARRH